MFSFSGVTMVLMNGDAGVLPVTTKPVRCLAELVTTMTTGTPKVRILTQGEEMFKIFLFACRLGTEQQHVIIKKAM